MEKNGERKKKKGQIADTHLSLFVFVPYNENASIFA